MVGVFFLLFILRRAAHWSPRVRYFLYGVRGSCFLVAFFVTVDFFDVGCLVSHSQKARPSEPPGGASLLVNRNFVRPRYALHGTEWRFYYSLRGPPLPALNDLRHLSRGLRHFFLFIIWHFVPQTEECRLGRSGRAGRFRARGREEAWRQF